MQNNKAIPGKSVSNNLVEAFDNLVQFFRGSLADFFAKPLNRESPYLAYLYPRPLRQMRGFKFKRQREAGLLGLERV